MGFLAFSEIHPDYYQIPVADKKLLLEDTFDLEDEKNNNIEIEFSNDDQITLILMKMKFFLQKIYPQIQKIQVFDNNEQTYQSLSFHSDEKEERIIIEHKELDNFSSDLNYNYKSIETKPISPAARYV